jgi:hypothetical protein
MVIMVKAIMAIITIMVPNMVMVDILKVNTEIINKVSQ